MPGKTKCTECEDGIIVNGRCTVCFSPQQGANPKKPATPAETADPETVDLPEEKTDEEATPNE